VSGAVAAAIAAAEASRTSHNAYITVVSSAPAAGTGELAGVPFAVKDNIDVAGLPTTAGSPLLEKHVPAVDAGVVSALREAGAVVIGKTNMHELAFGVTSNNATYGAVKNPVDPGFSAGGSSGGSAATVALGAVSFSLGTDTGGSVTLPASFCGVVGFRPSMGRYPADGLVGLSWSRDTVGLFTRTVTDTRRVDQVIARTAPAPARTLADAIIGIPRSRYADVAPEVTEVAERALAALRAAGATLVEVDIADDLALGGGPGLELVLYEAERLLADRARMASGKDTAFGDVPGRLASPDVRGLAEFMASNPLSADAYSAAQAARWGLRRSYARVFDETGAHALLGPACPVLPPPLGVDDVVELNGRSEPLFATVTRNTAPGSVAGVPMLTLPAGLAASGLPVGMTLEGRFFADDALLALGAEIEQLGWA
jgi:Asp-tRNA(Asn)/Glu-tRNA(Gln) amidotransferase A subunit family amidase